MYTQNSNTRKVLAVIAVLCAAAAIILAVFLFIGHEDRISALEAKIDNGTLTSADITDTAKAENMTREEVLNIVAQYIADNKIDYTQFVTRNEVENMIANAIAAYDRTRFDENGHCICCNGEHEVIDNSTHTTETRYVENPADFSGYYTREEVDALIREALASQVSATIPEADPQDQETVVDFIEADEGFQGNVGGDNNGFTEPAEGEGGNGNNDNTFVEPGEGFEGNGNNGGEAAEETPVTGQVIDLRTGHGDAEITDPVQPTEAPESEFVQPGAGEQGNANDDNSGFIAPSEGFEGTNNGNTGADGFEAPAEGSQGNGNADNGFVDPDAGYENGSSSEGQVIDLRSGNNANEAPAEVSEPEVGFSGVENGSTDENPGEGFVMPGEGVGFGG